MDEQEAKEFEESASFKIVLRMRIWDDLAKDTCMNLSSKCEELIEKYKQMLIRELATI